VRGQVWANKNSRTNEKKGRNNQGVPHSRPDIRATKYTALLVKEKPLKTAENTERYDL
jgi:hypothetical protein